MKSFVTACIVCVNLALGQAGRKFSTTWPKRYETKYVSIAKTTDDQYWMDGYYSTLVNQLGDLKLEMGQTLHIPKMQKNWHYQQWTSIINPEDKEWRESWAFTIKNILRAQRKMGNVDYWRLGFYGSRDLAEEPNNPHSAIAIGDQTTTQPWITVDEKTKIGPNDAA